MQKKKPKIRKSVNEIVTIDDIMNTEKHADFHDSSLKAFLRERLADEKKPESVDGRDLERFRQINDPSLYGPPPEARAKVTVPAAKLHDIKDTILFDIIESYKITRFFPELHRPPKHKMNAVHYATLGIARYSVESGGPVEEMLRTHGSKLSLDTRHYRKEVLRRMNKKPNLLISKTYQFDDDPARFSQDWKMLRWRQQPWPGIPFRKAVQAVTADNIIGRPNLHQVATPAPTGSTPISPELEIKPGANMENSLKTKPNADELAKKFLAKNDSGVNDNEKGWSSIDLNL